ncbi:uncharacterized protein LOC127749639 [Frankliniella occidentalis]|uniref:Uncharacterized protein LOC127749639 n=1 Tax=Frankliniella occidentalis TaxID=133901 RepID=A0A9C6U3K2_FRAOC|nr:uncharacterized protein LOC127749639 [Frankliniella occidentalis]
MDVSDLLVEWGHPELVEPFRDQQFDIESLLELDDSSLSKYIPLHGPRVKLLSKIRKLKKSIEGTPVEVVVVESASAFTDDALPGSSNSEGFTYNAVPGQSNSNSELGFTCDALPGPSNSDVASLMITEGGSAVSSSPAPKRSYEDLVLAETLVASALETLDVKAVLEGDALCKHILTQLQINVQPKGDWRKSILDVLVSQCLLKLSLNLTLPQLRGVAEKLVEVLPGEQLSTYYLGADHTRRLVSGKLVDKYNNLKSKLKYSGNKRHRSSASTSSADDTPPPAKSYSTEERQQSLAWLRFNRTPWPEVQRHWDVVYQDRMKLLYPRTKSRKDSNIPKYYVEYPVLTDKAGWQLLVADFEKIYPDKTGLLFATWPCIQKALLSTAIEHAKDSFSTTLISQLTNPSHRVTESVEILLHLMLLPSIFKMNTSVAYPADPSKPLGAKKFWKPTLAEQRDGFILHVKDPNMVKETLEKRQTFMEKVGLRCQPLIVLSGPSLMQYTHCQVSINGILYHVPGPLQAVDLAFKSFQVLNAWYPIESDQSWLFIQQEIFKIKCKSDKFNCTYLSSVATFKKHLE